MNYKQVVRTTVNLLLVNWFSNKSKVPCMIGNSSIVTLLFYHTLPTAFISSLYGPVTLACLLSFCCKSRCNRHTSTIMLADTLHQMNTDGRNKETKGGTWGRKNRIQKTKEDMQEEHREEQTKKESNKKIWEKQCRDLWEQSGLPKASYIGYWSCWIWGFQSQKQQMENFL